MSDPKPMYQILPVGEYTVHTGYGDAERPVTEKAEMTDERELFLAQLDGWIKALNIAIKEIEPFISQKKVTKASMHGMKIVFPCCTKFYKVLTEMQKSLYNLRKDGYR
jgi:hypothetical protein